MLSYLMRLAGGRPAFKIYGKGKREAEWRIIDVLATSRRNSTSRWPFFGGCCITWSSSIIAVGWDFAEWIVREQMESPVSRDWPLEVVGGQLRDSLKRAGARAASFPLASEVLAHECGHTCQARWFGPFYLPIGALFTWWHEGMRWWNWFENQASAIGQFGGIVTGSIHPDVWAAVTADRGSHDKNEQRNGLAE